MLQGFVVIYSKNNEKPLKNFNQERHMGESELHLRTSSDSFIINGLKRSKDRCGETSKEIITDLNDKILKWMINGGKNMDL